MTHRAHFAQFTAQGQSRLHTITNTLNLCAACATEMQACDPTATVEAL